MSQEAVNKSPINFSTSKMMWSIPKGERFHELGRSKSVDKFYDLPDIFNKKANTFSKAPRINPAVKKDVIDKFYDIPTNFNKNKPEAEAFTFGISRKYYEKVYIPKANVRDKNIPGPGQYELAKPLGNDAPKFIFYRRDKNKEKNEKDPQKEGKILGPGEYKLIETSKDGKYIVSHLKNVNSVPFGKKEEDRFTVVSKTVKPNLGPGQYNSLQLFNKTGFLFVSKFKSSPAKTFGKKTNNIHEIKKIDLGPGQYKVFSEFGYPNQNFDFMKNDGRNKTPDLKRSQTATKL